jgi:hypothetical protein
MSNGQNYQPTSAPYTADLLKPHDKNLVWLKEFGTNTTHNVGENFQTADAGGPVKLSVNARLGMLQSIQDGGEGTTMAGTSYLIPPWSSYPPSPLDPAVAAVCLFGHFLLADSNIDDPEETRGLLVFGAEDFVGNVDAKTCTTIEIASAPGGAVSSQGEEATLVVSQFGAGAGQDPTSTITFPHWGTNLYVRMMILGDVAEAKQAESVVWISRDGISWTVIEFVSIEADGPLRRIGVGTRGGPATAYLDWLRIYSYAIEGSTGDGAVLVPTLPLTGDRRY